MRVAPAVVDALLLGVGGRRRQLQDFPVLGDVWAQYADSDEPRHDLLITPTWEKPTGEVARLVAGEADGDGGVIQDRDVAYVQDVVAASLTLDELTCVAIPATKWWDGIADRWGGELPGPTIVAAWIEQELSDALLDEKSGPRLRQPSDPSDEEPLPAPFEDTRTENRQVAKLGLLLGVLRAAAHRGLEGDDPEPSTLKAVTDVLGQETIRDQGVEAIQLIVARYLDLAGGRESPWNGLIFQVSLNREATLADTESVGAIKADAAVSLFSIRCKDVSWAILDSGIDETHPAFWDLEKIWKQQASTSPAPAIQPNRVKATFDFRRIRDIMSVGREPDDVFVAEISSQIALEKDQTRDLLQKLADDRAAGRRVDWGKVRPLIEADTPEKPQHPHGTHVAGILGAKWLDRRASEQPEKSDPVKMTGVCPDISLYDFRVIGSDMAISEFAVIAAMQFIRFLNDQSGYSVIHGVNISLSIPHKVRNYACGKTPVCVEAEALVSNGVVVVAAAGNRGFQNYRLSDDTVFESYAASSITDPGNADGVITVGATHRDLPHTYGVSFFSSRGPTGDGRLKPDLMAPGEKIVSCVPGGRSDQMDGTSMAAPHVSGAAALLMARHQELKGQPARIKEILCATATDLNRERSFQGHGMVDVLRAIQSV